MGRCFRGRGCRQDPNAQAGVGQPTLDTIRADDLVYAVSDYWFDVLPTVRCAARRKLMVLHMEAPKFGQILARSRPDVDALRLASLHYSSSQEYSLRRFCR